ncbi:MAG: hypothetical protein FJ298_02890 [Planctomycetes bacterium]|nr:hypothetical protein [Planctomycetota bacterium]
MGTRGSASNNRRGSAIVMTLVCIVAVSTLSVVMLDMAESAQSEQRQEGDRTRAHYAAEAAASRAVAMLQAGGTGAIGSEQQRTSLDATRYWVDSSLNAAADVRTLIASGVSDRATARVEVTLNAVPDSIWKFAAFGDESLHMDSNARVDSYNSTLGTWASQAVHGSGSNLYANDSGNVGSNGDVTMDQNSKVWGSAQCGPGSATTVLGNAVVTGSTAPAPAIVDLPPLSIPSLVSSGDRTVNGTLNLPAGSYRYNTLNIRSGAIVNVTGPATVVVTNFVMRQNTQFRVNATNGPVKIYVYDDFVLSSNAQMYALNYDPDKLQVNLESDNVIDPDVTVELDVIDFDSNTKIFGTIYAPNAHIEVDSNLELFGAMMARSIDLDSNSRVHYDENLARARSNGSVVWTQVAWQALPTLARGDAN